MSVEIRDERFANVVGSSLTFECLADDFLFTEGRMGRRAAASDLQRHPRQHDVPVEPAQGRRRVSQTEQQVERSDLGSRGPAAEL